MAIKLDLKFQNNQLIEFEFENNQLIGNFQLIGQFSNFLNKAKKEDFVTKIPSENSEKLYFIIKVGLNLFPVGILTLNLELQQENTNLSWKKTQKFFSLSLKNVKI